MAGCQCGALLPLPRAVLLSFYVDGTSLVSEEALLFVNVTLYSTLPLLPFSLALSSYDLG